MANLMELLEDESCDATNLNKTSLLPSNEEAMKYLLATPQSPVIDSNHTQSPVNVNELCITVWEGGWYLGYALEIQYSSGMVYVDHLERVKESCNLL